LILPKIASETLALPAPFGRNKVAELAGTAALPPLQSGEGSEWLSARIETKGFDEYELER